MQTREASPHWSHHQPAFNNVRDIAPMVRAHRFVAIGVDQIRIVKGRPPRQRSAAVLNDWLRDMKWSQWASGMGPDRVKTQPAAYIDRIVMSEFGHEAIRRRRRSNTDHAAARVLG
jgi:hypothetical protein